MMNPRVLVVEDDVAVRSLLSAVLTRQGLDVESASDGMDGLEKLEHGSFDLILLDLMMPRVNGLQFLDALKDQPDAPPVLVMSAATEYFQGLNGKQVTAVIRKPFDIHELADIVRGALERMTGADALPG